MGSKALQFRCFSANLSTYSDQCRRHTRELHTRGMVDQTRQRLGETVPTPLPAYPHGERQWYKQANQGLYGTLSLRTGNTVSKQNEHKSSRKWKPNLQTKRLWSDALDRFVRVRIVTRVIRTIDKVGGLDNYLLGASKSRLRELGPWGWALRWRLWQTDAIRAKMAQQRDQLALPETAPWQRAEWLLEALGGRVDNGSIKSEGRTASANQTANGASSGDATELLRSKIDSALQDMAVRVEDGAATGMELNAPGRQALH